MQAASRSEVGFFGDGTGWHSLGKSRVFEIHSAIQLFLVIYGRLVDIQTPRKFVVMVKQRQENSHVNSNPNVH